MSGALRRLLLCWILLNSALLYGPTPTPGIASDKPKAEKAREQKESTADQRGTEQAPFITKVLPTENKNPQPDKISDDRKSESAVGWWPSAEGWLAIFTGGLFIATGILAWATRSLVKGAEDTAKRQLRAYISITGGEMVEQIQGSEIFGFRVNFKNAGQTPAYDVVSGARCTLTDLPRTEPLPSVPLTERSKSTFGPSIESALFPTMKIPTSEQLAAIASRKAAIHIHGRIEYRDAFDEHQTTNFNLIYRMTNTGRYIIGNDKDGNEAT